MSYNIYLHVCFQQFGNNFRLPLYETISTISKQILHVIFTTAKLHYIEPQGTDINGSIYPRFEISHIYLFILH